jgi:hypothetical protein
MRRKRAIAIPGTTLARFYRVHRSASAQRRAEHQQAERP